MASMAFVTFHKTSLRMHTRLKCLLYSANFNMKVRLWKRRVGRQNAVAR